MENMATAAKEATIGEADIYDEKVDRFIDPVTLKALSKIKTWRGLLQIALEWLGIAAAIVLCQVYWNPLLYVLTVMWIGARQNGLAVMMHEAVHYRLLRNRKWNDWIGEVFTAWPVLVTVNGFRQTHWAHHRHANKPEDPDWQRKQNELFEYPKSGLDMIFITLKYWIGFYAIKQLAEVNQAAKIPPRLRNIRLAVYLAVLIASIVFHFWLGLLIFWIAPLFLALSCTPAQEPGTLFVLIEPKFMKAPVATPIAAAEKTELVAATMSGTEVTYLSRADFDALKMDWTAFAEKTRESADAELKTVTTEYTRDRKKVILYAKIQSPHALIASAILAPKFLDLFKNTLGEKVLIVIPNRTTAYVFPALASNYQEYAPLIFEAYRATAFPVSKEVFELSAGGIKAIGAFEEP